MCKETKLDIYNISSWANTKCCFTFYVCATLSTTKIVFIMDFYDFSLSHSLCLSFSVFEKSVHNLSLYSLSLFQSRRTIFMQKIKRTLYQSASFVYTSFFLTQKDVCTHLQGAQGYCGCFRFFIIFIIPSIFLLFCICVNFRDIQDYFRLLLCVCLHSAHKKWEKRRGT